MPGTPAVSTALGVDHVAPRSVDWVKKTSCVSIAPLTQLMTIRSVASAPVGAPLAISTLGAGARSLRAPAMPSMVGRPSPGSKRPGCVTGPATGTGDDQLDPPLSDVDISSKLDLPSEESVPIPNTYVRPLLSVRIVQPSSGLRWPLLAAAPTAFSVQVLPPSVETATRSCAGAARPLFSWPWNLAQQMYTLPKNGLDEALSAQICDLSEKVVCDCCETSTGGIHAFLSLAAAAATLSVRDTAIASNPLKAVSERTPLKLDVRFE